MVPNVRQCQYTIYQILLLGAVRAGRLPAGGDAGPLLRPQLQPLVLRQGGGRHRHQGDSRGQPDEECLHQLHQHHGGHTDQAGAAAEELVLHLPVRPLS